MGPPPLAGLLSRSRRFLLDLQVSIVVMAVQREEVCEINTDLLTRSRQPRGGHLGVCCTAALFGIFQVQEFLMILNFYQYVEFTSIAEPRFTSMHAVRLAVTPGWLYTAALARWAYYISPHVYADNTTNLSNTEYIPLPSIMHSRVLSALLDAEVSRISITGQASQVAPPGHAAQVPCRHAVGRIT